MAPWIGSGMGLQSDFCDMCANFNIEVINTGAFSPWQNDICECNQAVVDDCCKTFGRLTKFKPRNGISLGCDCKTNSLSMIYGCKTYQLVFGANHYLPSVFIDKSPALEYNTVSHLPTSRTKLMIVTRSRKRTIKIISKNKRDQEPLHNPNKCQQDIQPPQMENDDNELQDHAPEMEAKIYADRLLKVVDSFVNDTLDALENEIGVCTPVWNLYNDILVISFCKYLVDTLNGFWFGVGWCVFFFIPSIIFATKLAKHYRKMKIHKCKDVKDKRSLPLPEVDTRHSPGLKKNKVAHSDGKDSLTSW
ncbi:PROM1 [Mytilus coruscus]|uniref:PROM1 n=1 Tax=Mytilus coruscus TaxID=42192 RepID=A0A6J8BS15_MYTCO|nr:PROM1 [Mytilus coruscus]